MRITISLAATTGTFETDINRASKTLQKRMKEAEATAKRAGVAIGAALAGVGAVFAVGVKRAIDYADALDNMAQRTGIQVEALSRLEVAARMSDTSLESLQKGLIALGKAQNAALEGSDEQADAFRRVGISLDELAGLKPDELLKRLADVFAGMPDGVQKTARAMEFFGRAGADLVPLLNEGAEGLERFERLADEMGLTVSTESAKSAAEFNDKLDLLQMSLDGVFRTAAKDLLPTLDDLAGKFNDPSFREGITALATGAATAIAKVAELTGELGRLAKFVGEEMAFRATGRAAADDIARLEAQAQALRERIAKQPSFVLLDLGGSAERKQKLQEQLKETETLIEEYYRGVAEAQRRAAQEAAKNAPKGIPMFDGETVVIHAGEGFGSGRSSGKGPRRDAGAEAAQRREEEAQRKLEQLLEARARATADVLRITEDLRAEMEGPMAQVQLDYARREEDLRSLAALAGLSNEELAKSLDLLAQARKRDLDATQAQIDAQKAYEQAIKDAPLIEEMDRFRASFEENVAGVLEGTKSIKDALRDMVSDFIAQLARMAAQQFTESLFGPMGSTATGSIGGGIFGLLGSLFGGPRAAGGAVSPGKAFLVGEQGPELFIPPGYGQIATAADTRKMLAGRGVTQINNFQMPGRYDLRTQGQIAADAGRSSRAALARATA